MSTSDVNSVNNKREIRGWAFYDWANSAFSTTVVTVFFGPFLAALAEQAADANGFLYLGNIPIQYNSFFPYVVSASVLFQVTILPILGALADYSHLRKKLMVFFSTLGALTTISMIFIASTDWTGWVWLGALLFIIANVSFGASIVFYNAFLPDIASEDRRDQVSTYGWALGYVGGGLLLLINLLMFAFLQDSLGQGLVVRLSLASAGVWWLGFSLITFKALRSHQKEIYETEKKTYFTAGFKQLGTLIGVSTSTVAILTLLPLLIPILFAISTFVTNLPIILILLPGLGPFIIIVLFGYSKVTTIPQTILFLFAYLLYNDGVQTVIVVAAIYAKDEVGVSDTFLIVLILFIQFVGVLGAFFFGWLADKIGNKTAIISSLVVWAFITIYAYVGLKNSSNSPILGMPWNQVELLVLGFLIAIVLGGSQALSRSLFSLIIPKNQETEFFSFYEVSDKGTSWFGTFLFGIANQFFNSLRVGVLSLIVFFIIGLVALPFVNVKKGIEDAKKASETV